MSIDNIRTMSRILKNKTLTTFKEIAERYVLESGINLKNLSIRELYAKLQKNSTTRHIRLNDSTNTTDDV